MTPEEQEKYYKDLCELAHDNETVLFAVKEIEKLTQQVIDLMEKNKALGLRVACLKLDNPSSWLEVPNND